MNTAHLTPVVDGPDASASVPAHSVRRSRPLLLLERTMYREGRTPFTSVFTIKLRGTLDEKQLRWALHTLQAKHSLLRCVVEHADGRPNFVLQERPAPIPLRIVERRGEDDWQSEVGREWTAPLGAGREPLARFVWLRGANASELILVAHHCLCDGQSGMNLLQECLRACDDPELEVETVDALNTMEELVPASLRQDQRFRRRVHWKMRLLRVGLLLKHKNAGEVRAPITSEQMYFHRWRLDAGASLSIMDRCRAEGVTVLAATTLAFLQAFRDIRGISALRKAYTMVNVRRFLPQLKPDALFGIAPGVELSLKKASPGKITETGFWECARAIKADMTRRIDRLGAGLYEYLVGLESLHDKYDSLVGETEGAPAVRHLTLSNMGRLDLQTQYRTFTLETVYSPMVMVSPTPANTVVLSSFAGQLEFAIVSDTQSLPQTDATAIQERAMAILRSCAGIADSATQALGARGGEPDGSGKEMKTFGLIFVLYHPKEEFLQNLARARVVCTNLVAVDNSPDADAHLHTCLREQDIHVIFNSNKGGLAGAYNRGAEVLLAQQCDVIFLMDQDSDIEPSFFVKMMDASAKLGTDTFLMGPKIYEINLKKCMAAFQPGKYLPKRIHIDDQTEGLIPSLCIISSGSAISAAAYRKLGAFREDYFIEYIDIEYSLRAVSRNVPVYMNAGVTMRQTTGQIERHGKGFTTNHLAWRRYYGARNAVHCLYTHRTTWGLHWVSAVLAVHQAVCVLRYEPEKLRKITAILCGYMDGLLGLLGTFESRHPLIAAYCKKNVHKPAAIHPGSPATLTGDNV